MSTPHYDAVVIGSGITGLTAAKRLTQRGLSVANLEGGVFGGLITNVNELEGEYAGSGADLASNLMLELTDLGCDMLAEPVMQVSGEGARLVVASEGATRRARAVIVASGAKLRRLGVPGEAELDCKGVSGCADCDGPMYQGEEVVVVGGGDSALQEALVLSRYCARVHVVHHGDDFTAKAHWVRALGEHGNVTIVPRSEIEAIQGSDMVEAVRVRSLADETVRTLDCKGVFAYVGLDPVAGFLPAAVRRDANGAVVTDMNFETALAGVFAAGAVRAGYLGTLTDAVREAQAAADAVMQRLQG